MDRNATQIGKNCVIVSVGVEKGEVIIIYLNILSCYRHICEHREKPMLSQVQMDFKTLLANFGHHIVSLFVKGYGKREVKNIFQFTEYFIKNVYVCITSA